MMFPEPLFSETEAILLLRWLDTADAYPVPRKTVKKLRSLVSLWR